MEMKMKESKAKKSNEKQVPPSRGRNVPIRGNEQELYLEHLMRMMVNVLDRGFQKN